MNSIETIPAPSVQINDGFNLTVKNLMVWVPEEKKIGNQTPKKAILKGINAEFKQGTITAIIGPSGSGKTTFVNYLSGRQDTSQMFRTHCDYYLNGSKIKDVNKFKNIIGYVMQEDIMETRNTPRQLFEHYAKLRGYPDSKKTAEIIIDSMYLKKCADTVVGDVFVRGCSGGEKKRTTIGIELISNPNLLFLDEPTTGLDSTTALDIIMNVVELKKKGMTIICTIHQPSEEIMALFDKIIMLVDGNVVYDDTPANILPHLNSLGFEKTEFETPIEFFMKIMDKDDIKIHQLTKTGIINAEEVDKIYEQRVHQFVSHQKQIIFKNDKPFEENPEQIKALQQIAETKNKPLPFFSQFGILFSYYARLFHTDTHRIAITTLMNWAIFAFNVIVFIKVPSASSDPTSHIQGRGGLFFMLTINMFFIGNAASSTIILAMKPIFLKDNQSRIYTRFTFFMAASVHQLPFFLLNIIIISIAYFFVFDLNFDLQIGLLWFLAFTFLSFLGGTSMGMIISTMADRFDQVGMFGAFLIIPMMLVTGFLVSVFTITWPLRIFSYIAPVRFIFQGFVLNEFTNVAPFFENCKIEMNCLYDPTKKCIYPIPQGTQFIANCDPFNRFNFEQKSIWLNFVIGIVLVLIWRIMAFVFFITKYKEKHTQYSEDQELFDKYCVRNFGMEDLALDKQISEDPRRKATQTFKKVSIDQKDIQDEDEIPFKPQFNSR